MVPTPVTATARIRHRDMPATAVVDAAATVATATGHGGIPPGAGAFAVATATGVELHEPPCCRPLADRSERVQVAAPLRARILAARVAAHGRLPPAVARQHASRCGPLRGGAVSAGGSSHGVRLSCSSGPKNPLRAARGAGENTRTRPHDRPGANRGAGTRPARSRLVKSGHAGESTHRMGCWRGVLRVSAPAVLMNAGGSHVRAVDRGVGSSRAEHEPCFPHAVTSASRFQRPTAPSPRRFDSLCPGHGI
jgi:hypothetical protein